MLKRHIARATLLGLIILAGCGDDTTGPTTPVDVTGTWNSAGTDANGSGFTFILTIMQSGATVTGTGRIINVITGTISGSVRGNMLTFEFAMPSNCAGSLNGTATLSGNQLSGSISGTTQCMGTVSATFLGVKEA